MSKVTKGQETQSNILQAARRLFYAQGYASTTTRQITQLSNVNLGLINYYFQSKGAIALLIYRDIREGFEGMLDQCGFDGSPVETYLMSVSADMLAALENKRYAMFYLEIAETTEIRSYVKRTVLAALHHHLVLPVSNELYLLTCASITALKPALIRAYYEHTGSISKAAVLRYYLNRYLWFFEKEYTLCNRLLEELKHYQIDVVDNFLPVFTRLD